MYISTNSLKQKYNNLNCLRHIRFDCLLVIQFLANPIDIQRFLVSFAVIPKPDMKT
jgi:hypothetical protein